MVLGDGHGANVPRKIFRKGAAGTGRSPPDAVHVVIKIPRRHVAEAQSLREADLLFPEVVYDLEELFAVYRIRASEPDAFFLCCRDPFGLARPYVLPLVFRHEGEHLQHDIGDKLSDERIRFGARIEDGHIEHEDICLYLVCDAVPFVDDHFIVAPQAVDGFYNEQIAAFEPLHKPQIVCAVEVFTAFLVAVDVVSLYSEIGECLELAGKILVARGNAGVCVNNILISFYEQIQYSV